MIGPRQGDARSAPRHRGGMTLLELTVALVVGGAALAAGGTAFTTLADRRAALLADAQVEERALTARRAMTAWVAGARFDSAGATLLAVHTQRTPAGRVDHDTLSLLTVANGEPSQVRIFVAGDDRGSALVADLASPTDSVPRRVVLASNVRGFTVTVLSTVRDDRAWRRHLITGALRPEAMRLRLTATDGAMLPGALRDDITVPLGGTP